MKVISFRSKKPLRVLIVSEAFSEIFPSWMIGDTVYRCRLQSSRFRHAKTTFVDDIQSHLCGVVSCVQVHQSNINGGAFRRRLVAMRGELLQSPWFVELSALHLNLADSRALPSPVNYGLGEFSCDFESDTPTLSCRVLESARLEFVLNCSICLVSGASVI